MAAFWTMTPASEKTVAFLFFEKKIKMNIYLSGKITGLPKEEAVSKFEKYENMFHNHDIFNPLKYCVEKYGWDKEHKFYLSVTLPFVFWCDTIVMISDWQDSVGAILEHEIARSLSKKILYV